MNGTIRLKVTILVCIAGILVFPQYSDSERKNKNGLSIGEQFHRDTSLMWTDALGDLFRPKPTKPPLFKHYRDAKVIKLPVPVYRGTDLENAIAQNPQ